MVGKLYDDKDCQFVDSLLDIIVKNGDSIEYENLLLELNKRSFGYNFYNSKISIATNDYELIRILKDTHEITKLGKEVNSLGGFKKYLQDIDNREIEDNKDTKTTKLYEKWQFWTGLIIGVAGIVVAIIYT